MPALPLCPDNSFGSNDVISSSAIVKLNPSVFLRISCSHHLITSLVVKFFILILVTDVGNWLLQIFILLEVYRYSAWAEAWLRHMIFAYVCICMSAFCKMLFLLHLEVNLTFTPLRWHVEESVFLGCLKLYALSALYVLNAPHAWMITKVQCGRSLAEGRALVQEKDTQGGFQQFCN